MQLLIALSFPVRPAMGMSLTTGGLDISARVALGSGLSVLWAATLFRCTSLHRKRSLSLLVSARRLSLPLAHLASLLEGRPSVRCMCLHAERRA